MDTQRNRSPNHSPLSPANTPADTAPRPTATVTATPPDPSQPPRQPEPPSLDLIQAAFPQLQLIEFIGQGGMGAVYKARQPGLDRYVALKILRQSLTSDAAFAERLVREGRAMARLNHPQIVAVYDCGQSSGFYYLLMEFVDGANLRQTMRTRHLAPQQAFSILSNLCDAIQFAHDAGIIHRDIKPENILLDSRGRPKIADFGMARLAGGSPLQNLTLTASGIPMGTPQYMAPEQFEHPHDVDQRSDIYSLGVVLYEMLTGELPIGHFSPPSKKSAVAPHVDDIVLRALANEPANRYHSARELKARIDALAASPSPPQKVPSLSAQPNLSSTIAAIPQPKRPFWCTLSAWAFIAIGLFALLDTLASLYSRPMNPALSPGLAHLFAGIALLTHSRRWRIAALVALTMAAAAVILITIMIAIAPERGTVTIPGSATQFHAVENPRVTAAAAIAIALLLIWPTYTLLTRHTRPLFKA